MQSQHRVATEQSEDQPAPTHPCPLLLGPASIRSLRSLSPAAIDARSRSSLFFFLCPPPPPPPASAADYEDPLTSLSLSLPGLDHQASSGFHHDSARSHFQELSPSRSPSPQSPPPTALPSPQAAAVPSQSSSYPFSGELVAAMQEMIRAEVRKYMSGVGLHAGCGPGAVSEACMPQLVEGVMRAAAEHIGIVTRQ